MADSPVSPALPPELIETMARGYYDGPLNRMDTPAELAGVRLRNALAAALAFRDPVSGAPAFYSAEEWADLNYQADVLAEGLREWKARAEAAERERDRLREGWLADGDNWERTLESCFPDAWDDDVTDESLIGHVRGLWAVAHLAAELAHVGPDEMAEAPSVTLALRRKVLNAVEVAYGREQIWADWTVKWHGAAERERDEAQRELQHVKNGAVAWCERAEVAEAERDEVWAVNEQRSADLMAMVEQRDALRRALRTYGRHAWNCTVRGTAATTTPCSCGLSELLEGTG